MRGELVPQSGQIRVVWFGYDLGSARFRDLRRQWSFGEVGAVQRSLMSLSTAFGLIAGMAPLMGRFEGSAQVLICLSKSWRLADLRIFPSAM